MQAGNTNICAEADRCWRTVLPILPWVRSCSLRTCLCAGGSGTELSAGRRRKLNLVAEVAWVRVGVSGVNKNDPGTQRTLGREIDRAKFQGKASMAR